MEALLPETEQFADVLLKAASATVAFEVQRTPISGQRWRQRSALYERAGVLDVWLLIGGKHGLTGRQAEGERLTCKARDLARTLYLEREQILHLELPDGEDATVENAVLTAMQGLANHYRIGALALEDHLDELHSRPVSEQPPWLTPAPPDGFNQGPIASWQHQSFSTRTISLDRQYVFAAPLAQATLALEEANAEADIFAGQDHQRATLAARRWETANIRWHKSWENRHTAWRKEEKRRREAAFRKRDVLLGRGVRSAFKRLLPATRALAREGSRQRSEKELREAEALPAPVRKWHPEQWTPLANIEVPLDWIFGCDRRLWQMAVYCTHFFHAYAKQYRSDYGIDAVGYDHMATGFALQALSRKDLFAIPHVWKIQKVLERLNSWVDEKAHKVDIQQGYLSTEIIVHQVRHLVVAAYFDELSKYDVLSQAGTPHAEETLKDLRGALSAAAQIERRPRKSLTEEAYACIGSRWLSLARKLAGADKSHYRITTPFLPPFLERSVHRSLTAAMKDQTLRITERGAYGKNGGILTFDWMSN